MSSVSSVVKKSFEVFFVDENALIAYWERGLNENTNGLICQYLLKSKPLNNVTEKELENIMGKLNHRPRKSLGWRTPYELFFNRKTLLTIALPS